MSWATRYDRILAEKAARRKAKPMITHYISCFTVNGPDDTQMAICLAWVDPKTFSTEPSCPACQAVLAEDVETARALVEEFPDLANILEIRR